jgi:hypothetical protein
MNKLIYTTLAASLIGSSAQAQTTMTPTAPTPSVITTAPTATPQAKMPDAGAPLPGSNSFTEAQATARFVELGYTDVKGLGKDSAGVWRGTAMKDGKSQNVALDFKGNIVVGQN